MKKIKTYRILGWILFSYGILGFVASLVSPEKLQKFMTNPQREFMPALFGILMVLATNIFLWAGILFLWRADKGENPNEKSTWDKIIKTYLIFTIAMFAWMAYLIIIPNLLRK